MSKFKEFKQKIKDNKGKIITGVLVIGGVTTVIAKQNYTIKQLKNSNAKQAEDIEILGTVMLDTVLPFIKKDLMGKLRNNIEELTGESLDDITDEEVRKLAKELVK